MEDTPSWISNIVRGAEKNLPSSLRDEWFDRLEELGIDDPGKAPPEMQYDTWWKSREQDGSQSLEK